ncbi:MAG: translation elongation factor Ts, partial [Clostridia bacterium]
MASFTNSDIMKLRELTGVGMMDCKKALVSTDGNMDEAVKFLREKGLAAAAKRASRIASEGIVCSYIDGNNGVLLEVNSETDFVARSEQFIAFCDKVSEFIISNHIDTLDTLLANSVISNLLGETTATIGEKISIRRFTVYSISNGVLDSYLHMGGKIGVMIEVNCDKADEKVAELAHNLCLQIAASKPEVVNRNQVSAESLSNEREIFRTQSLNEGKPANIVEKMVEGRISKYYKEVCLIEQDYVRDNAISIAQLIKQIETSVGAPISVARFVRYEMGEGIEKRVDNFVDEIMQ